ncbi:hypothetical protein HDF19_12375 [Mucilaginibacter sp. E4BP6]|uniref:hypothetical protein n=1 Tax=Mucilaginibacter sp. E4BP6 TaxID=2723089 RepID=UPI0015CB6030|nr:hypothetical protein [Mucilaginibacter sp. E4BP6]NYE65038.1 hypothetical protein [Mucilaginibacter sp. E4BP6]
MKPTRTLQAKFGRSLRSGFPLIRHKALGAGPVSAPIPNANKAANAKAQPPVHRSQSASGLIRQPQAQLRTQPKVGSERSREFFFWLLFFWRSKEK